MKQTVEEAAREFSDYNGCMPNASHSIIKQSHQRAFIRGAEWQAKQSPWISVEERLPEYGKKVLCLTSNGRVFISAYDNVKDINGYHIGYYWRCNTGAEKSIIAWVYIPTFDQIIEANKDVLQRLKEKGD